MPEEARQAETIVTSENLLEFQTKLLDASLPAVEVEAEEAEKKVEAKPEEKKEEKPEVVKDEKDDEKDEEVKQVRKGNPKIEKRFSELTEARKSAEAKANAERERAEAAERKAAELEAKYNPPKKVEDLGPEPQPGQFSDVSEYSKALKEWTSESTKIEVVREQQEKSAKEQHERVISTWKERLAAAQKELPDFADKIAAAQVKVSDQVRDALLESEVGPKILYHFAEHPEEAERIGRLTVGGALRELGKLEARLEKEPAKPEPKSPVSAAVAEVSKAPPPIAPLKGGKPVETRVDSQGVYHGTYAQYKRDRAAGKIK